MKVLIYGNRKSPDQIFDASTPEKEAAAYKKIFEELDGYWCVYDEVTGTQKRWYEAAKAGDAVAMKKLMTARKTYEYEEFREAVVIDPLA